MGLQEPRKFVGYKYQESVKPTVILYVRIHIYIDTNLQIIGCNMSLIRTGGG
jgi:hypothetical protein